MCNSCKIKAGSGRLSQSVVVGAVCNHQINLLKSFTDETYIEDSFINEMEYLTELRLGGTGMRGTIPDEFFELTRVTELDLSDASFSGSLSEEFSNFSETMRRIVLNNNSFSGRIPEGFAEMTLLSEYFCALSHRSVVLNVF